MIISLLMIEIYQFPRAITLLSLIWGKQLFINLGVYYHPYIISSEYISKYKFKHWPDYATMIDKILDKYGSCMCILIYSKWLDDCLHLTTINHTLMSCTIYLIVTYSLEHLAVYYQNSNLSLRFRHPQCVASTCRMMRSSIGHCYLSSKQVMNRQYMHIGL